MVQLQFPEFLLLAVPLAFACWRWGEFRPEWRWLLPIALWGLAAVSLWDPPWWSHLWLVAPAALFFLPWLRRTGITGAIRLVVVALLLLCLTGPEWDLGGKGIDVVIVADRSKSMPAAANVAELIQNIERNRRAGDRVGLVTFGQVARVEHDLSETVLADREFLQAVGTDGSDLNGALLKALELTTPDRPARILVLSDGESNGPSPAFAARRARELGVPVDYRLFEVLRTGDVAIRSLSLPDAVGPLQPFQISVDFHADRAAPAALTLSRNGRPFVTRPVDLLPGSNRIAFRDVIAEGGLHSYEARLDLAGDPLADNNRGEGVVRVEARPRLLVLNSDGQRGNLVRSLEAAELPVDVVRAGEHPLTQDSLEGYRGVVVENVPAGDFGRQKLERLTQFVEDLGGGLLLTGGQRSFGVGGYYQSPLDGLLPVSMEMREEHRKTRVAIVVVLDRSGSMAVPVAGGKTKMDLANLGTAEVVRLLTPGDSVAVIAVDTAPHVVQPLTDVVDPESIARKALGIQSMGGGIYVYEALVAAGNEIAKSKQATKHIILFSDANDSEEPGDYRNLLKKFELAGITVSVIGLGTDRDVDAALLKDVALLGRGNIMFTDDAQELPRLFTEDTMSVARSTFVEKDPQTQPDGIPGAMLPNARLMGDLADLARQQGFPPADGYNLSYLRPEATASVQSVDEYNAPWAAFWYRGLGRVAAITLEVDGQYSGAFGRWDRFDDFLVTHARWLMGTEPPADVYLDLQRVGQEAVLTVELDPRRPDKAAGGMPKVLIVPPGAEREERIEPALVWTGPDSLEARFRLTSFGTYRSLVVSPTPAGTPPRVMRGPVVTLPYSPEFDPRDGLPSGREVLDEVADISQGQARTDVVEILRDPPRSARTMSMLPWLFGAGIGLLLVEVAGRRLSLWEWIGQCFERWLGGARPVATTESGTDVEAAPLPRVSARGGPQSWWRRWRTRRWRVTTPAAERAPGGDSGGNPSAPAPPTAPPGPKPAIDVFAAAKNRARKRLK